MPKARQRIVICDCLDCAEPADFNTGLTLSPANEAVAKQLPPPKSFIIVVTASACKVDDPETPCSLDVPTYPHIRKLAREGGLGFLAFRQHGSDHPDAEVGQLLGLATGADGSGPDDKTLQKRFKNMVAMFDSNVPEVHGVCSTAGMQRATLLNSEPSSSGGTHLPDTGVVGAAVLKHLGIQAPAAQEGPTSPPDEEVPDLDILLLHVDSLAAASPAPASGPASSPQERYDAACSALQWTDELLKYLAQVQAVKETVLVALVLTPSGQPFASGVLQPSGTTLQPGQQLSGSGEAAAPQGPPVQRPLQSFQTLQGQAVEVALDAPAVVVRRLPGVVRRDRAEGVGVQEVASKGVHGCILADRLVHEIAYKVARAPKYGA